VEEKGKMKGKPRKTRITIIERLRKRKDETGILIRELEKSGNCGRSYRT
jgi:hypothetical protein